MAADDDRLRDGRRIAELLAAELAGRSERGLDRLAVRDAEPEVEPTPDGARAFTITTNGVRLATVLVQPEQALLELNRHPDAVEPTASEADLEIQASPDTATRLVVPDGAAVKRAVRVLRTLGPG